MHSRLGHLYECGCGECKHEKQDLQLALDPKFKALLKAVEKAYKKLHKNGKYSVDDLKKTKAFQDVVKETNGFLSRALEDNSLSEAMEKSLREDVFLFSQFKTHAQLMEASSMLLDADKKIKSFAAFSKDVAGIKSNYNENYLEAEYDFAVGSVLTAEKWDSFSDGDRYYLQYRTAKDDRVRDSHRLLDETTLPKTDPFWDKYFPPNGWRCRCTTVEVLARKNTATDSKAANKNGEAATSQLDKNGKNKLEIFRFNPGKEKVVFPPKHPYRKVQDANKIK